MESFPDYLHINALKNKLKIAYITIELQNKYVDNGKHLQCFFILHILSLQINPGVIYRFYGEII